ncbi:MAG: DUF998 domain-containing protein, partial [Anaerolineales bacterium]|nr:DUF998 domain-containing protein [Anaerolineales bacterium]
LFVVLTVIAMFLYPGGTFTDSTTHGYSFLENFFSELGMVRTHTGDEKTASLVLFVVAMFLAGTGMMTFFAAFQQFFRTNRFTRTLSLIGSGLGILSGICFIGVATAPADTNMPLHTDFVMWAFRLFPAAILCYVLVLFREKTYPRFYALELIIFLALLIAYLLLLEFGPGIHTYTGMAIQAAGQKIIVYTSIASVMVQCWGTRKL